MTPNFRPRGAWGILAVLLATEVIACAFLLIGMLPTFPPAGPERDALAPLWVSLLVSLVLAIVWLAATFVGVVRTRGGWVRASAVTFHILLVPIAVNVRGGVLGTELIGNVMIVMAVIGFVAAILAKPVEPKDATEPDGSPEPDGAPEAQ